MRRTFLFSTALAVSALALAGCAAAPSSDRSVEYLTEAQSAPMAPYLVEEAGGQAADSDRQVITTGWVTVTVAEPLEAATEAIRITESAGGRVDGRSELAPLNGDKGSATLTLRIPAAALTATIDKLKELGDVQEVSLNASDVTMQTQDLDARIGALQASVDRLLGLLATATDTDTLIQLETAISGRQGELDSLKSQQRYLADQVAMSTLTLSLVSTADAPVREPDTFLSGLVAGWNAFVAFFAGLLVVLGVLLPWLVFAGIVTLVIILLVRRSRRTAAPVAAPDPTTSKATKP